MREPHLLQPIEIAQPLLSFRDDARFAGRRGTALRYSAQRQCANIALAPRARHVAPAKAEAIAIRQEVLRRPWA
jgi:hypothetical protein